MLSKDDRKFIVDVLDKRFEDNNKVLDNKYKERNDSLVKDVVDLFEVTNSVIEKVDNKLSDKIDKTNERIDEVNKNLSEKIDDTNERIDKIFDHLSNDFESIEDHEKRIGKIEEKIFSISA